MPYKILKEQNMVFIISAHELYKQEKIYFVLNQNIEIFSSPSGSVINARLSPMQQRFDPKHCHMVQFVVTTPDRLFGSVSLHNISTNMPCSLSMRQTFDKLLLHCC